MKNLILLTILIVAALPAGAFQTQRFAEVDKSQSVDPNGSDLGSPQKIDSDPVNELNAPDLYKKDKPEKSRDTTLRRNTIKLDITSNWLYRNAFVLSYERVTKPNQSFSITVGSQHFPSIGSFGENIDVDKERDATGYKFGGEYRFYLKKENKYSAPRGVYVGPYLTYLAFKNGRTITVDNEGTPEQATLDTKLSVLNIGVQLGYQFVLNNRWTIDLIFVGPSVSNYYANLKLGGNYTFDPEDVQNEILADLIDRFPALGDLLTDKEIESNGKVNSWAYGYRYQFLIGYHFGRKKK
jgi:hypothetical protein